MTDFINDIELSVRAGNVLQNMGIDNLDAFMALSRDEVLGQKNAGVKTWREVAEIQSHFRHQAEYAHALACQRAKEKAQALQASWSKRDEIALAAMQSLVSTRTTEDFDRVMGANKIGPKAAAEAFSGVTADWAYMLADAMLAAREAKETNT